MPKKLMRYHLSLACSVVAEEGATDQELLATACEECRDLMEILAVEEEEMVKDEVDDEA